MATTIRLYGSEQLTPLVEDDTKEYFTLEESFEISQSRAPGEIKKVTIGDNEYVELIFSDDSTWFGDSKNLKEIFPELKAQTRSADDAPELPVSLESDDASRSLIGDIALKIFRRFAKKQIQRTIRDIATEIEDKGLRDSVTKIKRKGLYSLNSKFELVKYIAPDTADSKPASDNQKDAKPFLLFIHGTSSSTEGAFGDLKDSRVWNDIVDHYGANILAFEHRTLTEGPFQNVLDLIKELPANHKFDVVTHSRGGIVGELLMRFSESLQGFMNESRDLLAEEERADDIPLIDEACSLAAKKNISVGRFVRVACTARGTSLLSERTDIFLNTLINLINVSGPLLTPLVGGLKLLISETIDSKNSFKELPGLEAQRPVSAVIKSLNTCKQFDEKQNPVGFENRLAVISGNGKLSLSLNGLKIVLTKFFFKWKENDLVVDTASMYQGAKRKDPVQYFLDHQPKTNHFNYFLNQTTRDALWHALFSPGDNLPTFKKVQGENFDAAANRGALGLDNGKLAPVKPSGTKPIVILLPGIMGSFLEKGNEADRNLKSLWINYLRFATGGLTRLAIADDDNINATGVIKTAYEDLVKFLSARYDVLVFPFDWRRPVEKAGEQLAAQLEEFKKLPVTVSLVGHSMGGLVIRDLIINQKETWKWLNGQPGFRTILLGTPWLGSYRIPYVLSGKDSIIKRLDLIDFAHGRKKLINMFAKFPGLLDLLPIHDSRDFGSAKVWEDFTSASGLGTEPMVDDLLKNFAAYTKKIADGIGNIDFSNIVYVAGKHKETVKDYIIENGRLKFFSTDEGDQSVTWASGIPAGIDREKSLYYTSATHGGLSKKDFLFPGIMEILQTGTTTSHEFSRKPLVSGGRSFESKEKFEFESSEACIETDILGLDGMLTGEEANTPILNVSVSNGDLMFSRYPVMIGHFAYDDIYNAEDIANTYLKKGLQYKHKLGLYPGPIGTSEYFPNPDESNDFDGCVIVGLGLSETLNAYQLTLTIEKAVSDYLLTHCKNKVAKQANNEIKKLGLSTLLIGAGYAGMAIETTCRAIMQGVINANQSVISLTGLQELYISDLEFIELYEDKSIACFTSINTLMQGNSDGMNLGWAEKSIRRNPGARKRLFTDLINTWWQRLSVLSEKGKLIFYSSTNSAREEKKEISEKMQRLESIIETISTNKQWSYERARSLFEQLIPADFKETIRRNAPILWVVDINAAQYPWELLQTGSEKEKPLCISAPMIRQLAMADYKSPTAIKSNNVIVIGDPDLEGFEKARQLPGAAREAKEVYDLLYQYRNRLNVEPPLINATVGRISVDLYKQDYKIIHIAAHGFFDSTGEGKAGILIGKSKSGDPIFLTPEDITQLPGTPELVFINCCFLGKISAYAEEYSANRNRIAANIGTELISKGVKAVVVAGWEVDDTAALAFAKTFYTAMLEDRKNFGDAVHHAREHVYQYHKHTNTWGAFQCYGQPQFRLDIDRPKKPEIKFDIPQEAENSLENIISKSEVSFYNPENLKKDLVKISKAIEKAKFDLPVLKQLEATAYLELNEYDKALSIFNELFKSEQAGYQVKALETFQHVSIKRVVKGFIEADLAKALSDELVQEARSTIDHHISNVNYLINIWETSERYSIIGGACKRKAFILGHIKNAETAKAQMTEALEESAKFYYKGYKILDDSYNFCNWLALSIFLGRLQEDWQEKYTVHSKDNSDQMSVQAIEEIINKLAEKKSKDSGQLFWSLSGVSDISLCRFLLNPDKDNVVQLAKDFRNAWTKSGSINKKSRQKENIDMLIYFAEKTDHKKIATQLKAVKKDLDKIWD